LVGVTVNYTQPDQPSWCDNAGKKFDVSGVYPGLTGTSTAVVGYKNNGSINGTVKLSVIGLKEYENNCVAPEVVAGEVQTSCNNDVDSTSGNEPTDDGTLGELGGELKLNITHGSETVTKTLQELAAVGGEVDLGALAGNANDSVSVNWELPIGADNKVQTDGVNFGIQFTLEQI
jgi:hypothetical protein